MESARAVKKYPLYKEAADRVKETLLEDPSAIIYHQDMEKMFDAAYGTKEYNFSLMQLKGVLSMCNIELIVIRNTGYRMASDSDKVNIIAPQQHQKSVNALKKLQRVLVGADPTNMSKDERVSWEKWLTKAAMELAYENQLPLKRVQLSPCKIDNPKPVLVTKKD
jgi:hypothetical protein